MQYRLAPLFCRPWALNGITPRLIESHYETNYGSAVYHLDVVTEELQALDPATAPIESMSRLKRDQPAALNSTLLHELYFASLGGDGRAVPETMAILALDMLRQQCQGLCRGLHAQHRLERRPGSLRGCG